MGKNITLIGMPTSGKSTVGVILAKVLGMDFVDTDLIIQRTAGKRLADIIEEDGLEGFLGIENQVCSQVEAENTVIATGGSVVYGEEAMKHLKEISQVIYLEIDYETLEQRLHHVKQRGVVLKPGQTKKELYDERAVLYKKYADEMISEEGLDIEGTVQAIIMKTGDGSLS
ncbi:shikimate kinase [Lachnospiraceae bacterium NE2001]|nr:shikimate kinase [Lachnospiraceae bacterium NE2001]